MDFIAIELSKLENINKKWRLNNINNGLDTKDTLESSKRMKIILTKK